MAKIVKKLKSGRKGKADGGDVKDPLNAKAGLYNSLGNATGNFIDESITSFIPEGTDWRKNPLSDLKKKDSLTTAGSIGSSTAKGAGTGAAIGTFLLPGIGTGVGAGIGAAIGAGKEALKSLFTSKKKKEERKTNEMNWATGMSSLASADNAVGSYKEGGEKGGKIEGAGTAKSDSIDKKVEDGSFIVPAENAEKAMQYGKSYLNWKGDESANRKYPGTEVALSNGEVLFTPEESDILRYHGIDLDSLAPNADNDKEMKKGGDKFSKYTTEEYAEILASGKTPDETPDRSIFDKMMDFAPEAAGALQIGAAARGNQKAGEMPDINVSESLRLLAAETRKEAEYGLEPGAKAAMFNQTEKARRDATNAIVGKGGSATSMMSNLQSVLSTTIDKKYNIELTDAAEKARKKSLYYGAKTKLGDQELDVKKFAMDNWRGLQEVNAGLLSAGIGNIVGARKLKKEMDLMKEIGSDKATFTT